MTANQVLVVLNALGQGLDDRHRRSEGAEGDGRVNFLGPEAIAGEDLADRPRAALVMRQCEQCLGDAYPEGAPRPRQRLTQPPGELAGVTGLAGQDPIAWAATGSASDRPSWSISLISPGSSCHRVSRAWKSAPSCPAKQGSPNVSRRNSAQALAIPQLCRDGSHAATRARQQRKRPLTCTTA